MFGADLQITEGTYWFGSYDNGLFPGAVGKPLLHMGKPRDSTSMRSIQCSKSATARSG
jgi:hypothetical protein